MAGVVEQVPQFARACRTVSVMLIRAYSAQGKGLIEHFWNPMQDRLSKDFKRLGITSIEAANVYLRRYYLRWNKRHSITPSSPESAFQPSRPEKELQLLFAKHEHRVLTKGLTFSYQNTRYGFKERTAPLKPNTTITVVDSLHQSLKALYEGQIYVPIHVDHLPTSYYTKNS